MQEVIELLCLGAAVFPLDAGVDVLRVLAEDDHIHIFRMGDRRHYALEPAHRAQADVQVEALAEVDVEAADAASHRCGEGALDAYAVFPEGFEGIIGHIAAQGLEGLLAGRYLKPVEFLLAVVGLFDCCVEDCLRCGCHFRADSVALDEWDGLDCHCFRLLRAEPALNQRICCSLYVWFAQMVSLLPSSWWRMTAMRPPGVMVEQMTSMTSPLRTLS